MICDSLWTYEILGPRHRRLRHLTISANRSKLPRRTPSATCRIDSLLNVAKLALKLHYFSPRAPDLSPSINSNVNVVLLMRPSSGWTFGSLRTV